MIVADRPLLGYPDTRIELHLEFSPDEYKIEIHDSVGVTTWEAATREDAKDRFFHPFAYGYTAPEILLDYDYDE